jgi:hypothetical protein
VSWIWARDQDAYNWQALTGLLDLDVILLGSSLSESEKSSLAKDLSAYTAQNIMLLSV